MLFAQKHLAVCTDSTKIRPITEGESVCSGSGSHSHRGQLATVSGADDVC